MTESLKANPDLGINLEQLHLFSSKDDGLKKKISYMITLGGDGTILYGAKQFTGPYIPLIVSFAMVRIVKNNCFIGVSWISVQL